MLLDKSWTRQSAVGILGPQDLSYNEIAKIISAVLKKEITYATIPADSYVGMLKQFGSSEAAAKDLVDLYSSMTKGTFCRVERNATNSSPTGFQDWCERILKPMIENKVRCKSR